MTAEAATISRTWKVGNRTVTLTLPKPKRGGVQSCVIEWAPDVPPTVSAAELAEYRAGRNAALAELARELGGNVAVLEV